MIMNEALLIWLYLGLCKIATLYATVFLVVAMVAGVFGSLSYLMPLYEKEKQENLDKMKAVYGAVPVKTLVFLFVICLMVPSKDDIKYIIGGALVVNGAQAAAEIEGVEKLPKNLVNAMNVFLEDIAETE